MSGVASLSQLFVLSPRGDTIILRQFREDGTTRNTAEAFFRAVKFWPEGGDAPPVFELEGVQYLWIREKGLHFVGTTRYNVSPSYVLELLSRIAKICRDYTGILSEESVRRNFVLVYELLDEALDYGFPQCTSTEVLKSFIYNEPVVVEQAKQSAASKSSQTNKRTAPSSAVHKPVIGSERGAGGSGGGKARNEVFVDVIERVTVLFNQTGMVLKSEIDGTIQMKSFLHGNPELRLALNEDLLVGKHQNSYMGGGGVVFDDCNFHECVNLDEFENHRTLLLTPPEGEFAVMNYRITGEFRTPFKIFAHIEEPSAQQMEMIVRVRADFPDTAFANVRIEFPVPRNITSGVSLSLGRGADAAGQGAEFRAKDNKVLWSVKKFQGGVEHALRAKISLKSPSTSTTRRELGPVSMMFEIPMHGVSNLQIRYLRVVDRSRTSNPYRWVRYVTQSSSYVCRVSS